MDDFGDDDDLGDKFTLFDEDEEDDDSFNLIGEDDNGGEE